MDFASQDMTIGQLNAIVKKLGGEEGALRFLRGETVVVRRTPLDFKVWKSVKLGTGLGDINTFSMALKFGKLRISDWARDMFTQPDFATAVEEVEVDLVNIAVEDLGLAKGAVYKDICIRALEQGLQLCPPEVGPQLRLQYVHQPSEEWLRVAMKAIADSGGDLRIFAVGHGRGELWLDSVDGRPVSFYEPQHRFVFARRRA